MAVERRGACGAETAARHFEGNFRYLIAYYRIILYYCAEQGIDDNVICLLSPKEASRRFSMPSPGLEGQLKQENFILGSST